MATDERVQGQGQEAIVIYWRLDNWFPELGKETLQKMKAYHEHLLRFNKTLNLISVKTISSCDQLHFADSILASRIILKAEPSLDSIYDFGSGNGFPGIIFGMLSPKTKVVLVESDLRKVEFLNNTIQALGIANVITMHQTIESLPENSVKTAMARGLSSISRSILLARKVVAKGGHFYHLKGEEWGLEVSEIPTQLCSVWSPSLTGDYKHPVGNNTKFSIIQTEKIA